MATRNIFVCDRCGDESVVPFTDQVTLAVVYSHEALLDRRYMSMDLCRDCKDGAFALVDGFLNDGGVLGRSEAASRVPNG